MWSRRLQQRSSSLLPAVPVNSLVTNGRSRFSWIPLVDPYLATRTAECATLLNLELFRSRFDATKKP